ncbi:MAG: pyridine nucleotide-disulfide oxidoreductase [Chryseobacterium sp.]|jgi:thioredoxin reductase|nr:pyridine nucleotide-disulfide oxidoreductase [Chryseobacterium sp.]
MESDQIFDVIIIGGSYSGLSAAMTLGRSQRKTLIIDNGFACNKVTSFSHNFLTQDGHKINDIADIAKKQVLNYPHANLIDDKAVNGERSLNHFAINTAKGNIYITKKMIFATGIKDLLPDIKGLKECWGTSVVHCPYCHGYELRNRKTAIWCDGNEAFNMAALIKNMASDLIMITNNKNDFTQHQLEKLRKNNVEIVESTIVEFLHDHSQLKGVLLADGRQIHLEVVYTSVPFTQHSDLPLLLGCTMTDNGLIELNDYQQTNIPGVYACGDNSAAMRTISKAVYTGNLAGAMVNKELAEESF